jgi:hypothetical protein
MTLPCNVGSALDGMVPGQCSLIARGNNRELPAKLYHSEDLRQLGRAITHSAAQPSCRTALHGSSVRRIC